jgi:signal transduction histidine kinase
MEKKKLKILMLEDLEEDAGLIERTLKKEDVLFTRMRVETRHDFTKALDAFEPDIILSDHSLPQFNSIEALDICQRQKLDIPFILVTGAVSEEFAVTCLRRGADDYILKSNLSRLPMAIHQALRQHQSEHDRINQEEMLRSQNEKLGKINKELDSFVYSISHNLRSPLSSVLGLVNVAKMDGQKSLDVVDRYFELIENSILKLDETLHEILYFSQNARTDVELSEVDLVRLIDECLVQAKGLKGNDNVAKRVEVKQTIPFYSDRYRLSIILNCIFSNAIHYRDLSKPDQYMEIICKVNPAYVSITVADNGIGIPHEYLTQVFDMFVRATERSEGAGLGLYIVKEMVAKMRGRVELSSTLYEGTSLSLTIPNGLMKH